MAVFFKGDDVNIIGGRPRVVMTAYANAAPTQLGEIISLSTYALNSTYNWVEMGLTDGGVETGFGATTTEWRNDQFGRFKVQPNEYSGSFKVKMLEYDATHKRNWIAIASPEADPVASQKLTNYVARPDFPAKRLAVLTIDDLGFVHALIFPKVYWNGSQIMRTWTPDQPLPTALEWLAVPDDNKTDTTTGYPVLAYDLDQIS